MEVGPIERSRTLRQKVTNKPSYLVPFALITSLFFLWGFAISMLDVLNKHFQEVLNVSRARSGFVQLMVYGAYFIMGLPAGQFMKRFGFKRGIIGGLLLYAVGAFLFYPAAIIQSYHFFLLSLFILGCGLATLETAANPYITVLGDPAGAAQRLNLAQSFNGLGVILGPLVGGLLIFAKGNPNSNPLSSIQLPYIVIGSVVLLVALVFTAVRLPEVQPEAETDSQGSGQRKPLFQQKHLVYGVITQFFYVGVQAGVWGFFINFATEDVQGMTNQKAAFYLSGGMLLFTLGRFSSTVIMRYMKPNRLLLVYGAISLALTALVIARLGMVSVYAMIGICFCMSIMFPTIFALGVRNLGAQTKQGASLMIMSIAGGAVIPPLMGLIADKMNTAVSFCLPALGFIIVIAYALKGYKLRQTNMPA